jgi:hypothetical protein
MEALAKCQVEDLGFSSDKPKAEVDEETIEAP